MSPLNEAEQRIVNRYREKKDMEQNTPDSPFDIARVDRALEQIRLHPETWYQPSWRCETGMCLAGWVIEQNGDQWANKDPNGPLSNYVLVDADTPNSMDQEYVDRWLSSSILLPEGKALLSAKQRADMLLGLTGDHDLYNEDNSLEALQELRDQMANGEVPRHEYDDDDDYYDDED